MAKISLYYKDTGRDARLVKTMRERARKQYRSLSSYVRMVLLEHLEGPNKRRRK